MGEQSMPTLAPQDWAVTEGVTCVSCPACAFTFDAAHTEVDETGGPYDCPACFVHRALYLRCQICGQVKWASTPERAVYLLAFHMDRRHQGWTMSPAVTPHPPAQSGRSKATSDG